MLLPHPSLVLGVLLAASAALAGCASAPPMQSGICIGERTLKQIEEGETRESWLRAVLGEPTSVAPIPDEAGVTVLRYSTLQQADDGLLGSLLGRSDERAVATIYFIVKDGVVVRFWDDRVQEAGLFSGKPAGGEKRDS